MKGNVGSRNDGAPWKPAWLRQCTAMNGSSSPVIPHLINLLISRIILYLGDPSALICKVIATGSRPSIKVNTKRAIQGVHTSAGFCAFNQFDIEDHGIVWVGRDLASKIILVPHACPVPHPTFSGCSRESAISTWVETNVEKYLPVSTAENTITAHGEAVCCSWAVAVRQWKLTALWRLCPSFPFIMVSVLSSVWDNHSSWHFSSSEPFKCHPFSAITTWTSWPVL